MQFPVRRESALACGCPGCGKIHLLSALGQELARQGWRVAVAACAKLVRDSRSAKGDLRLTNAIRKLAYYEALTGTMSVRLAHDPEGSSENPPGLDRLRSANWFPKPLTQNLKMPISPRWKEWLVRPNAWTRAVPADHAHVIKSFNGSIEVGKNK